MNEGAVLAAIDVVNTLFWLLRVAAAIGGALVGWFGTAPLVRLLYRAAFHRPVPRWLVPWARLVGAGLFGFLIFYYLPLGGGSGLGWGPGPGGGPGAGPGNGSANKDGKGSTDSAKPHATDKNVAPMPKMVLETLEIELIGGKRYKNDGLFRFYLIKRLEPAVSLDEVEDYLKKNKDRLEKDVTVVLTSESVAAQHNAVLRLNTIIERYALVPQLKNIDTEPGKN